MIVFLKRKLHDSLSTQRKNYRLALPENIGVTLAIKAKLTSLKEVQKQFGVQEKASAAR